MYGEGGIRFWIRTLTKWCTPPQLWDYISHYALGHLAVLCCPWRTGEKRRQQEWIHTIYWPVNLPPFSLLLIGSSVSTLDGRTWRPDWRQIQNSVVRTPSVPITRFVAYDHKHIKKWIYHRLLSSSGSLGISLQLVQFNQNNFLFLFDITPARLIKLLTQSTWAASQSENVTLIINIILQPLRLPLIDVTLLMITLCMMDKQISPLKKSGSVKTLTL